MMDGLSVFCLLLAGGGVLFGLVQRLRARRQLAQKVTYLPQSRTVPNITAYRMVLHGRALCMARKPNCAACPLRPLCDYGSTGQG